MRSFASVRVHDTSVVIGETASIGKKSWAGFALGRGARMTRPIRWKIRASIAGVEQWAHGQDLSLINKARPVTPYGGPVYL